MIDHVKVLHHAHCSRVVLAKDLNLFLLIGFNRSLPGADLVNPKLHGSFIHSLVAVKGSDTARLHVPCAVIGKSSVLSYLGVVTVSEEVNELFVVLQL